MGYLEYCAVKQSEWTCFTETPFRHALTKSQHEALRNRQGSDVCTFQQHCLSPSCGKLGGLEDFVCIAHLKALPPVCFLNLSSLQSDEKAMPEYQAAAGTGLQIDR